MLSVSEEQIEATNRPREQAFVDRLVRHVQQTFPKTAAQLRAAGRLRPRVEAAWQQAKQYGFVTERHAAAYVDLTFLVGPNLPTRVWAAPVLADEGPTPAVRLRRLQVRAAQQSRAE